MFMLSVLCGRARNRAQPAVEDYSAPQWNEFLNHSERNPGQHGEERSVEERRSKTRQHLLRNALRKLEVFSLARVANRYHNIDFAFKDV